MKKQTISVVDSGGLFETSGDVPPRKEGSVKLSDLKKEFIEYHTLACHSSKTIATYTGHLQRFLKFSGDVALQQVTQELIKQYTLSLLSQELSSATVRSYLTHLRAFFHWAADKEYVSPKLYQSIILPKTGKKIVKVYNSSEIQEIFEEIKAFPIWIQLRNRLIVALMIDSGLRQNEVSTIRTEEIDFELATVKVHGKGRKERFVPLGKLTQSLLADYLTACPYKEGEYLFKDKLGEPLSNNAIKLFISKLQRKLGYPVSSHKLRHNFATNYVLDQYDAYNYVDIYRLMALMGHEEITTTRNYIHAAQQIIACRSNISHLDQLSLHL